MKTIAIVDGDSIAYRNASATEGRKIEVTHLPTGKYKVFKNRTEFKELLKSKDKLDLLDDYLIVDVQEPEPVEHALALVKRLLNNIQEFCWADSMEIYLGSGKVFRHDLPLPSIYKSNRTDMIKPVHLEACREYMQKTWKAQLVTGIEADDFVNIRGYEELAKGNRPIICSIDKDAYSSSGLSLLNYSESDWKIIEIPVVGELHKKGTAFKGTGLKFLAYQILAGDVTDNFKPYALSEVKYGPTKAFNALQECKTEQEVLEAVKREYKRLYPDPVTFVDGHGDERTFDWKQMLELYFQCAYMKRKLNDDTTAESFFKEKGVSL